CPSCELTFRVPADSDQPQPVAPLRPETVVPTGSPRPPASTPGAYEAGFRHGEPGAEDFDRAERARARNLVQLPAILLLITGLLGVVVNLIQVFYGAFTPPPADRPGVPDWLVELQKGAHGPMAVGMGF